VNPLPFQIVFWLCAGLVAYTYLGYPLFLYLFIHPREVDANSASDSSPRVSFLISAYNEQAVIAQKLENALALDYPPSRLEIIVISDCSEDRTDDIVRGFAAKGVQLVRQSERLGKSAGLNVGAQKAAGGILVFSDANAMYQPDAIRHLVKHFADARVGYVVGNARYTEKAGQTPSAESEGLYWKLETWLKQKESQFGSVVGGDGAIYAMRRQLFTPLRPTDISDLLSPLQIIAQGYRGLYEPAAICYEEAGDTFDKEFHRKVRIVSRSLNAVCRAPRVLLPWSQPRHWYALVSHKVLRWFAPIFLITQLGIALLLWRSSFYGLAGLVQVGFYALAATGWAIESRSKAPKMFYLPYYFCLVNTASLLGILKWLRGSLSPTWQTVREEGQMGPGTPVRWARK